MLFNSTRVETLTEAATAHASGRRCAAMTLTSLSLIGRDFDGGAAHHAEPVRLGAAHESGSLRADASGVHSAPVRRHANTPSAVGQASRKVLATDQHDIFFKQRERFPRLWRECMLRDQHAVTASP
ncbi:MAG TPA: hypothetical protein VFI22_19710, partial [Thermomicrobiales bacterium]|nr:hypothetical protein [Thermomicrobiales bacterium]